ncbi:MAG: hypothetical protein AAFX06_01120 [Planctomycetota bacterium]
MKQFAPLFSVLLLATANHAFADVNQSGRSILIPLELDEPVQADVQKPQAIPKSEPANAVTENQTSTPAGVQPAAVPETPQPSIAPTTAAKQRTRPSPRRAGLFQRIEAQWRKRGWLRQSQRH